MTRKEYCFASLCRSDLTHRAMASTTAAPAPPPTTTATNNSSGNNSVTAFYSHVVQNVMQNVRVDFEAEGLDETVLEELQSVCSFPCLLSFFLHDNLLLAFQLWNIYCASRPSKFRICVSRMGRDPTRCKIFVSLMANT